MRISHLLYAFIGLCFFSFAKASDIAADSGQSKNFDVKVFTVLKVQGNFNVVLTQSGTCSLSVTADKDLMSSIDVKNQGVTLNITMKADAKGTATLYIGIKDINQITITTTGNVSNVGTLKSSDLSVNIDGTAVVSFNLNIDVLNYNTSSGKETVVKGKAKKSTLKNTGEGNVDASALEVKDMNIDDESDGDLKVYVSSDMVMKITGTGNFTYYGKPKIKSFHVEGAAASSQIKEGSK